MLPKYRMIINHYGFRNQMKECNSAVYDLIEAIDNYEDCLLALEESRPMVDVEVLHISRSHVVCEMANILHILTQFVVLYEIDSEEINPILDKKLADDINHIEDMLKKGDMNDESN